MIKHIDTAPIIEAYAEGGECPLCALYDQTEGVFLDAFLGGSVMEPDVRVVVNQKGFCARHFTRLYGMGNRLGVALMAHTHLKKKIADIKSNDFMPARRSLFKKTAQTESQRASCACCDKLDDTMARYLETVIHLFETNSSFRELMKNGKGLCLPHFYELTRLARANGKTEFADALREVELRSLEELERDLEWFTLKFDYRNNDKPWGNSKDALVRALMKESRANVRE